MSCQSPDHPPSNKKLRSAPPDIIVAVGSGDKIQEFECYRVLLSSSSDYFDTMLSNDMKENVTGRIEFPDKDPETWKKVYAFIDPRQFLDATIRSDNIDELLPLFHEFRMENQLFDCDNFLSKSEELKCACPNPSQALNVLKKPSICPEKVRKTFIDRLVKLLKTSHEYHLNSTFLAASKKITQLAKNIRNTWDLFDLETSEVLLTFHDQSEDIHSLIKEYLDNSFCGWKDYEGDMITLAKFLQNSFIHKAVVLQLTGQLEGTTQRYKKIVDNLQQTLKKSEEAGKKANSIMEQCKKCTKASNEI